MPPNGSANEPVESQGKAASQSEKPENGGVPPRERGRRLRTLQHVKAGLAHNIREMEAGRRHALIGNALTNSYRTLAEVMSGDIAGEIAELRKAIQSERSRLDA